MSERDQMTSVLPEVGMLLSLYAGPFHFAIDWLLNRLSPEEALLRQGVREPGLCRLIQEIDRPGASDEFLDLLDMAQCYVSEQIPGPDPPLWADLPSVPPGRFASDVRAWLARRGLVLTEPSEPDWDQFWKHMTGANPVAAFHKMTTRLARLRSSLVQGLSVIEECLIHEYPEVLETPPPGETVPLSFRELLARRLRSWCRRHAHPVQSGRCVQAVLAQWTKDDIDEFFRILSGSGDEATEVTLKQDEDTALTPAKRTAAPLLVVAEEAKVRKELRRLAQHAPTGGASIRHGYAQPEDIPNSLADAASPCVLAVPGPSSSPEEILNRLVERLNKPRVVLLLDEDVPSLAWELIAQGAYDVLYRWGYSPARLCEVIAHAANGAQQRPYSALDTVEREARSSAGQRWATVLQECVDSDTDKLDAQAMRLLPDCLRLEEEAVVFQERLTAPPATLPGETSLVMALLSLEPESEEKRRSFLEVMRDLEQEGRRVLYLQRAGVSWPADLQRDSAQKVRYFSACELVLRLAFGFGAKVREPASVRERRYHDTIPGLAR